MLRHSVGQILLLGRQTTTLATIYIEMYSNNSTTALCVSNCQNRENYREKVLDIVGKIYFLLFCTIPNITAIYKTSKCMYISDPSVNVTSAIASSCKCNHETDDNNRMTIFETFKRHFSAKFEKMLLQYST